MSDENSYGAVATEAPAAAAPVDEASGRSSKALLLAGGVAVVVLAVFAYFLFFSGSEDPADTGAVPSAAVAGKTTTTDKTKDTAKETTKSTKQQDVEGRNPFEPLQGATTTTDTSTDTSTDTTTDTTTPTGETVTVSLVSVSKSTVTAKVDSKTYKNVGEGETFASSFQVYAIFNDECAGFLYGDDSFALCEGKSVDLAKL